MTPSSLNRPDPGPRVATEDAQTPLFLRALKRQAVPRPPIWLMRQAGRYLPEYNATRRRAGSFLTLMRTPELACEVTLQPIQRFGFDASIIFSDILTVPDALGADLQFIQGEGPVLRQTVRSEAELQQLRSFDPAALQYVYDAIRLTRQALPSQVPLIGFSGSPWTLACYMVDGRGGGEFWQTRSMLYQQPTLLQALLNRLCLAVIDYLKAQIDAGANAVMLFDSWGGLLPPAWFEIFSLAYLRRIISALQQHYAEHCVPIIVFCRGAGASLDAIVATGCDALGVDWTQSLPQAFTQVAGRCAVQGNLDPAVLMGSPQQVRAAVESLLNGLAMPFSKPLTESAQIEPGAGHDLHEQSAAPTLPPGYIFNLGHGISQFTPIASVEALLETVHNYRQPTTF